ncbi:MAG: hypothetical protein LC099_10765 [Anaerolineales bacterium]|nr:hypothetical protein [Anaerolineales bacterium]
MKPSDVMKRYTREMIVWFAIYSVTLIVSLNLLRSMEMGQPLKTMIALLPAVPIAGVLVSIMRVMRDSDELMQRLYFLATSFSALLTAFITFTYGFLENIGFPKFPTFLIMPMMFAFWGLSLFWFSKRYK